MFPMCLDPEREEWLMTNQGTTLQDTLLKRSNSKACFVAWESHLTPVDLCFVFL